MSDIEKIKEVIDSKFVIDSVRAVDKEGLLELLDQIDEEEFSYFLITARNSTRRVRLSKTSDISLDALVDETFELTEKAKMLETTVSEYDPKFLLENAKILEENKDYALARNIYNALIRKGLAVPHALAGLGRTLEADDKLEEAIRCYQEAIAYSSEYPFYIELAGLQMRVGRDQDAVETLLYALGVPDLSKEQRFEVNKMLGNSFTRLGDYPKAEQYYRKAYELNSKSDELQVNVGSLAFQKNDLQSAKEHFEKALELNPKNPKALSGLGMVHLAKSEFQRSHDLFIQSLRISLDNLSGIYNLLKCAYELDHFEDTEQVLLAFLKSYPNNTNILYSYAGVLYQTAQFEECRIQLMKIFEINPSHSGALEIQEMLNAKK